jgi:hypothetical protein
MILKAPFLLPPDFLAAFGYPGGRRFVALYWEPCGDEACYDDGAASACGLCDNWLYLGFVHSADVGRWLDENAIHLGNSDEGARHWLIIDASTGEVYSTPRQEAYPILLQQSLPG